MPAQLEGIHAQGLGEQVHLLSDANTICGSPNPRNAPQGTLCVRTTFASTLTLGTR